MRHDAPPPPDTDNERLIDEALHAQNVDRLHASALPLLVIHLVHLLVFALWVDASTPVRVAWREQILGAHTVLAAIAALIFGVTSTRRLPASFDVAVATMYVCAGALIAAIDQAVTPAITPYFVGTLGAALLLRLRPRAIALTWTIGLLTYAAALGVASTDPAQRSSNLVNGVTVTIMSATLAVIFFRAQHHGLQQQRIIERQRQEIDEALAVAEASAARAKAANAAKGVFLAHMSHEIRTPLNAILGLTDLIAHDARDDRQRAWSRGIDSAGRALLALLTDLLDLSRADAGRVVFHPEPTDLRRLLEEIGLALRPIAAQRAVGFRVDAAEIDAVVEVDPTRLRQVVFNLAANAERFTDEGEVVLSARCPAPTDGRSDLVVRVRDTGVGIPAAEQATIFEPFVQQQGQTRGGSGLGLAIAHHLVREMGGAITLVSEVGVGTVFEVSLPDLAAAPLPPAEALAAPAAVPSARPRLDLPDDLHALRDACRRSGRIDQVEAFARALAKHATAEGSAEGGRRAEEILAAVDHFDVTAMMSPIEHGFHDRRRA